MMTNNIYQPIQGVLDFSENTRKKSDVTINYFLACFYAGGLLLANFYDTWTVAIGIGGLSLIAYYFTRYFLTDSDMYQYVLGAVFGIFMAQYIYEMHGLFEMHFIAFIGSAILITYQNWKLQIPLALVVILHHAAFGYLQFIGFEKIYFTQLEYMTLQTFIIHVTLALSIFFICGLWAYRFKKLSCTHIEQSFEIGRLQEEQLKKEELLILTQNLKSSNDRLCEAQHIAKLGNWSWDPRSGTVERSDENYKIFERTKEEVTTTTGGFYNLLHPDDVELVRALVKQALVDHQPFSYEARIIMPDGRSKIIFSQGKVETDEEGKVTEVHGTIQDITEIRSTEIELDKANRELNLLFTNIDDVLFSVDMNKGVITQISPSCIKAYGYTQADFMANGELWHKVIHQDDRHIITGQIATLSRGEEIRNQYRIIHKNGSVKWLENTIIPTLDEHGKLKRIDGVTRNITERKIAELALQESKANLRSIIENTDIGFMLLDSHSNILSMNRVVNEWAVTSLKTNLTIGKPFLDYLPAYRQHIVRGYFEKVLGGEHVVYETDYEQITGGHKYFEVKVFPVSENDNRIIGVAFAMTDITEQKQANDKLKQSEAELRRIFNTIDEVIYSVDMVSNKITQMSPACIKLYGYEATDFYADMELWNKITHPEDAEKIAGYFPQLYAGKQVIDECRVIHKSGEIRWVEFNMIPALDEAGMIIRIDGVAKNVTERKTNEEKIKALNESLEGKVKKRTAELETVNKELESFSYSVSHDLRAPLRIMQGYAQILLSTENALTNEGINGLTAIMNSASQMGHLIDDLLSFSRLGRASLNTMQTDMNEIVKKSIEEIMAQYEGSATLFKVHELPTAICDPMLMKQVWINLISNAVKYSRKKDKPVVEIGITSRNNNITTFFVKDNGAGFDMKFYSKLFAVFQRLHKVTEYEGTGVGLALVDRIINKHRGAIWAEAKVNEGAIFYFTLPN